MLFKKVLLFTLVIVFIFSCAPDRSADVTRTAQFGWTKLRDSSDGMYTTTDTFSFTIRHMRGAITYWIDPDTTGGGANQSDSCWTIYLEIYNEESGEWGKVWSTSESTKLDTIDRAQVNVGATDIDTYIPLAVFNDYQLAWGDQARIIEVIGTGDKMGGDRWVGGQ